MVEPKIYVGDRKLNFSRLLSEADTDNRIDLVIVPQGIIQRLNNDDRRTFSSSKAAKPFQLPNYKSKRTLWLTRQHRRRIA
jgi:hypothetical protein